MIDKQMSATLEAEAVPSSPQDSISDTQPVIDRASTVQIAATRIPTPRLQPVLSIEAMEKLLFHKISVIIPARNEAENLRYVLPYIPTIVSEVILVDGHSTDNTVEVARQLMPTIRVIEQTGKGKGDALRAGFAACTGDIIVMLDADGSADPCEIPRFVEALLEGSDFAKGSRFLKDGGSHDITPLRSLGNFGLTGLVNLLYRTGFSDLCYGYNAFWKRCLDAVDIDCDGFEIETLLNLRMLKADLKISEVPSFEYPRIHGQSNLRTFHDGWRVLKTIVKERLRKAPALSFPRFEVVIAEE